MLQGKKKEIWEIRKKLLGITGHVLFSKTPFHIKIKLVMLALMPYLYMAILKKKLVCETSVFV